MKNIKSLFLFLILGLGIINAQSSFNINPFPMNEPLNLTSGDTLNLLAVMVEFNRDNDGNTFGNGKFGSIYSQDYGNDILDPLPHDQAYFESHLKFAENYFEKVSNGVVNIDYTVLPNIVTVSKIMREYSPEINSNDFTPMGEFSDEVWALTDAAYPDIDFSNYDLFTVFHAGVGREIPTPGSIGLERDLPSVYLSSNALKNIFGDDFQGFEVGNNNFRITNTMILPSTENREIESFGEVFLQEFTTNGLIVSSIASHLGLPDLFNTETGRSAIGRFGLMDGQAIFTYRGLFPPEPSPWEKMYLGWIEPVTLNIADQKVTLTASEIASASDTALVKIPINSTEYYLVENRKRDANKDGIILTYKVGNAENTITFQKDLVSFSPFGVDTISGVVTDVDEFDWAVPGFEDSQSFDDPFEDIGLVIWHIDEGVINSNLESNTINNNRDRLGVRVVEADGIFDIGEEFTNIFGETILGEGTKQDTWYASNPAKLYKNIFNQHSEPPALTNSGANSLIEISDISSISNKMLFNLRYGSNAVSLVSKTQLDIDADINGILPFGQSIAVNVGNDLHLYDLNGTVIGRIDNVSNLLPAIFERDNVSYITGAVADTLTVTVISGQDISTYKTTIQGSVSSSVVILPNVNTFNVFAGTENGLLHEFTFDENTTEKFSLVNSYNAFQNDAVKQIVATSENIAAISETQLYWNGGNFDVPGELTKLTVIQNEINGNISYVPVVLTADNSFYKVNAGNLELIKKISEADTVITDFAAANLKSDGNNYITFSYDHKVDAINLQGGRADFFPFEFDINGSFGDANLSIDLNDNGYSDVIMFDDQGTIYAVDGSTTEIIEGFPFSSGAKNRVHPIMLNEGDIYLVTVNENVEMSVWSLGPEAEFDGWASIYGNAFNNAFVEAAIGEDEITEFFPVDRAYNWPNPVYEGETYIRFYVSENADVNLRIFDLSGDLVDRINYQATGGLDNEIPWNINDIQSGVYFAHLEVSGAGGQSESKIIKIAVIK